MLRNGRRYATLRCLAHNNERVIWWCHFVTAIRRRAAYSIIYYSFLFIELSGTPQQIATARALTSSGAESDAITYNSIL